MSYHDVLFAYLQGTKLAIKQVVMLYSFQRVEKVMEIADYADNSLWFSQKPALVYG